MSNAVSVVPLWFLLLVFSASDALQNWPVTHDES